MREISVARHKDVKIDRGECEQFAILLAGPPHLWRGPHIMADEIALQAPWEALVKQDAHGRGAPPWPAPEPPRLARGSRWGNLRGTRTAAALLRGSQAASRAAHGCRRTRACRP